MTNPEPAPEGFARWNGELLARALGNASADQVWSVLRHLGISLERRRSWCVSTDPQFSAKAVDVVGLYLAPPVPCGGAHCRRKARHASPGAVPGILAPAQCAGNDRIRSRLQTSRLQHFTRGLRDSDRTSYGRTFSPQAAGRICRLLGSAGCGLPRANPPPDPRPPEHPTARTTAPVAPTPSSDPFLLHPDPLLLGSIRLQCGSPSSPPKPCPARVSPAPTNSPKPSTPSSPPTTTAPFPSVPFRWTKVRVEPKTTNK